MEPPVSTTSRKRPRNRSTHLITTVASLSGARPLMLRAAFRAGLASRDTGVDVAKGLEKGGIVAMVAEAGLVVGKFLTEESVSHPLLLAAGCAFASIGAVTYAVGTFGRMTREQANYSRSLIKENPLLAMNDCLGQRRVWDEMDANLLGRGIESMTSYIKRNTDDMLHRPSHAPADQIYAEQTAGQSPEVQARLAALDTEATAKKLFADHELRQSLIDTWKLVERSVTFAFDKRMLQHGDATALMIEDLQQPARDNLRQLKLLPEAPLPL